VTIALGSASDEHVLVLIHESPSKRRNEKRHYRNDADSEGAGAVYGCDQIIGRMAENTFLDSIIPVLTRQTGLYTFDYTDTMLGHAGVSDCHRGHKVRSVHQRMDVYITVLVQQQLSKQHTAIISRSKQYIHLSTTYITQ
jgi:hypothetical protein